MKPIKILKILLVSKFACMSACLTHGFTSRCEKKTPKQANRILLFRRRDDSKRMKKNYNYVAIITTITPCSFKWTHEFVNVAKRFVFTCFRLVNAITFSGYIHWVRRTDFLLCLFSCKEIGSNFFLQLFV